ncbi:hypothetical protein [Paenibacillus pini]|uniref:Peptidase n=1 Tax=Paenibacillus pini JCM 16418 TaxID=1236976 RepID=W7Z088_9BACL|nr:hypothetical protein [Paenibacillus pini]GAF10361.1 hypothetical protein JCM16418_4547 [Paenibacillus pini JCM 16418]
MMSLTLKKEIQFYPVDGGLFHVYDPGTMRHFKIGQREVQWLNLLNGENDRDDLAQIIPEEHVDAFMMQAERMQLVVSQQKRRRINPLKLKFRLLNPNRMLESIPRFNLVYRKVLNAAFVISLLINIVWLTMHWQLMAGALLSFNLNMGSIIFYVIAILFIGFIHELSHSIVAKSFGIHVPSIGLMLFYLHPAFFADVSGLNLLKSKRQRINILLAGLMSNCIMVTLSIPLYYILFNHSSLLYLIYFMMLNVTIMFVNMVPFVEYDGYYLFLNLVNDPAFKIKSRQSMFNPRRAKSEHLIFGIMSNLFIASLLFSAILMIRRYVLTLTSSNLVDYVTIGLLPIVYLAFMLLQNRRTA